MSFALRCILKEARYVQIFSVQQQRYLKRWLAPTLKAMYKRKERHEYLYGPIPIPKRSAFLEWNFGSEVFAFGKRLGEQFDDNLLRQAFTQADYLHKISEEQKNLGLENPDSVLVSSNEELAREGRELISQYVFGFLRHTLKKLPEEGVRSIHDKLLGDEMLAHISKNLGTKDIILTAEHEPSEGTYSKVFCAIVAALSRSSTADRTGGFIRDFVLAQLAENSLAEFYIPEKPWATLEALCPGVEARLANAEGHGTIMAAYRVAVFNKDKLFLGEGFGETVKVAKNLASVDALNKMFEIHDARSPLPLGPNECPKIEEIGLKMNNPNPAINELTPNIVRLG
ncbi:large ribosomal subunit protein mL44 [Neocloeon triangulifer]|uniref:large ribosomal subunit protein mL44 n=1 Tax=Neocloeon triangulifer TaxID=2078957 RepID=UPI00286F1908|nr:large ribosomal subunit protein mL44 [Neocloeon triangulifer]